MWSVVVLLCWNGGWMGLEVGVRVFVLRRCEFLMWVDVGV